MLTSALALPVPVMLWALFMPTSLRAQETQWDKPNCTKGVVSVSRGERAMMTCSISNPISNVSIGMMGPGNDTQYIFENKSQGNFSKCGWQLLVQGGTARLVTEKAQDTQAGQYKWRLEGYQRNHEITTLNVSAEPQQLLFTSSQGSEMLFLPKATSQSQSQVPTAVVIILILAFSCVLIWHKRRCFRRSQQCLQESQESQF